MSRKLQSVGIGALVGLGLFCSIAGFVRDWKVALDILGGAAYLRFSWILWRRWFGPKPKPQPQRFPWIMLGDAPCPCCGQPECVGECVCDECGPDCAAHGEQHGN